MENIHGNAKVTVILDNRLLSTQLLAAMRQHIPTLTDQVLLSTEAASPDPACKAVVLDLNAMAGPWRLGAVMDKIAYALESGPGRRTVIACGPYLLAIEDGLLYFPDKEAEPIRLTEKERDILVRLQAAQGAFVRRDLLLEEIWGYGPAIETHTLETHIYRLRQKIEIDPANPHWLLSDEAGYRLVQK